MLPLLCIFTLSNASALEPVHPQQDPQEIIYVSESAAVFGADEFSNATVVKVKTTPAIKISKKPAHSLTRNETRAVNKQSANHRIKLPKSSCFFKSSRSGENFNARNFSNSGNSVIASSFSAKDCVSYSSIALISPVYFYRMKFYVSDFSKTAALSHFLFSRPPPFC